MKKISLLSYLACAFILVACNDDYKFTNELDPELEKKISIVFPGDSDSYTAAYEVNTVMKLKATVRAEAGITEVKWGLVLGESADMQPVEITETPARYEFEHSVLIDENISNKDLKGFRVSAKDKEGNTVEKTYSITGNIIKDPVFIKYPSIQISNHIEGTYPNPVVTGTSYFSSLLGALNYEQAFANQGMVDFMLIANIDGGNHEVQDYPFGIFTPNRQNENPLTAYVYQKDFTVYNDVYMSYIGDAISSQVFDMLYSGELDFASNILPVMQAYAARINDKGWVWIPPGGVLFIRIGGGIITDISQALNPDIRWGLVRLNTNWGTTLVDQTADLTVMIQRPEASGITL